MGWRQEKDYQCKTDRQGREMAKPKAAKTSRVVNPDRANGKAFGRNSRNAAAHPFTPDKIGHNHWGRTKPSGSTMFGYKVSYSNGLASKTSFLIMSMTRDGIRRRELKRLRKLNGNVVPVGPMFKTPRGVFQMMEILDDQTKVKMAKLRSTLVG